MRRGGSSGGVGAGPRGVIVMAANSRGDDWRSAREATRTTFLDKVEKRVSAYEYK